MVKVLQQQIQYLRVRRSSIGDGVGVGAEDFVGERSTETGYTAVARVVEKRRLARLGRLLPN